MSKLNEKQRLIVTIAVSALLTGGLVALILGDRSEINGIQAEIGTVEAHIRACDVEIKKTSNREGQVLVFRAVENRELAILPTQQKIADFLRNLSTFFGTSGIEFQRAPESSPKESELAKGIYETRTRLTVAGEASAILKFMNMVENDPRLVAIKGYRVSAGQRDKEAPDKPILHDVEITLATYFYNPSESDIRRVHIPNEQKRMQEDSVKTAIEDFQPERPDTYVLRPSASRRDPFVDPRKKRVVQDPEEYARLYKEELEVVDELQAAFDLIAENIEKEKALVQAGDLFRADRLGRQIDKDANELRARLQHVTEMKRVTIPDLQSRLQKTISDLDVVMARRPRRDVTVTRGIAEHTLASLAELFRNGEYTDLANEAAAWDGYVRGKDIDPEARPTLDRIKALKRKSKDVSDFNAYRMNVTGCIIDKEDPRRSVAWINGHSHRIGDKLDEAGEVIVARISKTAVYFEFRNQEVAVGVGRRKIQPSGGGMALNVTAPVPDDGAK